MEDFYGMEVFVGKTVKPKIPQDCLLHVTQVALPPTASHAITLLVKVKDQSFVLATLDPRQALFHMNVDMLFSHQQELAFTCEGAAGAIHVIGYTEPAGDVAEEDDEEEEEEARAPARHRH
ncbi:RNA binding protein [Novymonas esmeraldas]|uniref:RNA binding protein n=1 Tax=Novymonas esmeraldas TaxID=1808958 RepID=A0AAW0EST2_9TRYP